MKLFNKAHFNLDYLLAGDKTLASLILGLLIFGIFMVYDSTSVLATKNFGGGLYFLRNQLTWVGLGTVIGLVFYVLPYRKLRYFANFFYIASIALLLAVLVPGIGQNINGATRWLGIGPFVIQPSEFAKLALVLYLSTYLTSISENSKKFTSYIIPVLLLVFPVLLQPNLSTVIIMTMIAMTLYFVDSGNLTDIIKYSLIAIVVALILILSSSYRRERLITYLSPHQSDTLAQGYQLNQITLAIGSGGLFGRGIGYSRQKYEYLPEVCSDSILAVIAEELGFFGVLLLIITYSLIIQRGLKIAMNTQEHFGKYLALGITTWLMLQVIVNSASMVGIIPLTGVTLPLISCGGSSIIALLIGIGILLNVSRQANE